MKVVLCVFLFVASCLGQRGVLVTGSKKVLMTQDGGESWLISHTVPGVELPTAACYGPKNSVVVLGYEEQGDDFIPKGALWSSSSWTNFSLPPSDVYYSCAVSKDFTIIGAGINGAIVRSTNLGSSWSLAYRPTTVNEPSFVVTLYNSISNLFVCAGQYTDMSSGAPQYLFSSSRDNGVSWTDETPTDIQSYGISSGATCGNVAVAWSSQGSYFRQVNGGALKEQNNLQEFMTVDSMGCLNATTFVGCACDGPTQYGTFVSTNAGLNFTYHDQIVNGFPCFTSFYASPKGNMIFAAGQNDATAPYVSKDGVSWSK